MFDDNDNYDDIPFDVEAQIEAILEQGNYSADEIAIIKERVITAMQDPAYLEAFQAAGEDGDVFLSVDAEGNYKAITVTDPDVIDAMNELYYSDPPPTIH